jgi:hypothetical protein
METSDERRKRRLARLCEQYGGVRAVAERSGVAWATLDQILKGTLLPVKKGDGTRSPRSLGDANARAIEDAMQLGRGWFDWPFDGVDFKAYAGLTEAEKAGVQGHMIAAIEGRAEKALTPEALQIARWFDRLTDPRDRAVAETGAMGVILRVLQQHDLPPIDSLESDAGSGKQPALGQSPAPTLPPKPAKSQRPQVARSGRRG